jgi:hypothetical protein
MSLLTEQMETFALMVRTTVSDGYGGFTTTWSEGDTFQAAAAYDTTLEARVAAVQGATSVYTIYTAKAVSLAYYAVIKRKSDGKVFRVTSDSVDKQTPLSAGLDMRVVTAEEYVLSDTVVEPEVTNGQS